MWISGLRGSAVVNHASCASISQPSANRAESGSYAVSVIHARSSPNRKPSVGAEWRSWRRVATRTPASSNSPGGEVAHVDVLLLERDRVEGLVGEQ